MPEYYKYINIHLNSSVYVFLCFFGWLLPLLHHHHINSLLFSMHFHNNSMLAQGSHSRAKVKETSAILNTCSLIHLQGFQINSFVKCYNKGNKEKQDLFNPFYFLLYSSNSSNVNVKMPAAEEVVVKVIGEYSCLHACTTTRKCISLV